jgi:tRNA-binding protein
MPTVPCGNAGPGPPVVTSKGDMMDQIGYDDFLKVDIRVGRVIEVDDFPKARKPAYKLRIDFGPLGVKTSSAQVTTHYGKEDLLGTQVLAVVNFPPRQIADFFSEVLTLGVELGPGDIVMVHPEREVPLGLPLR